jgi:hypothetical protein
MCIIVYIILKNMIKNRDWMVSDLKKTFEYYRKVKIRVLNYQDE